ncbi:hypothetical protein [Streptomyces sp. NPDC059224]|uniref:hypothetical protein n=1 Tax=Streptomyces sp. NPDC059224 TaxID=3346775 RepID=UPI0036BD59BC
MPAVSGQSYLVEPVAAPTTALPYAQVSCSPATTARHLGAAQIGIDGGGTPGTGSVVSSRRTPTAATSPPRTPVPLP